MKKRFEITETLSRIIDIEFNEKIQDFNIKDLIDKYNNEEIVLDSSDFVDVSFKEII